MVGGSRDCRVPVKRQGMSVVDVGGGLKGLEGRYVTIAGPLRQCVRKRPEFSNLNEFRGCVDAYQELSLYTNRGSNIRS